MNSELAKQLKDAGFPQILGHEFITPNGDMMQISGAFPQYAVMLPTLDELIEACGDRFYSLVYAMENDWRCFSEREGDYIDTADGKTPEIAVAKLWLALHNSK